MRNVKTEVDKDGFMLIAVDLTKRFGLSKSEKNISVASTEGAIDVVHAGVTFKVGLNVYTSK